MIHVFEKNFLSYFCDWSESTVLFETALWLLWPLQIMFFPTSWAPPLLTREARTASSAPGNTHYPRTRNGNVTQAGKLKSFPRVPLTDGKMFFFINLVLIEG